MVGKFEVESSFRDSRTVEFLSGGALSRPSDSEPFKSRKPPPPREVPNPARSTGLSLIIPAYNEADRIGPTLDRYLPALERLGLPYEVIVVMDGQDDTPRIVRGYDSRGVIGYRFPTKLGRGGAILAGFRKAKYDVIAYADADGSIPIDDGIELIGMVLNGEPAVVASRRIEPALVVVPEPPLKRFASLSWHLLTLVLLNLKVKDAQCGFKVFRREVAELVLRQLTVTNRTFEVGMLYHIIAAGFPIREVPVSYAHDARTRMPLGKAIPIMLLTLVGMFLANRTRAGDVSSFNRWGHQFNERFASI